MFSRCIIIVPHPTILCPKEHLILLSVILYKSISSSLILRNPVRVINFVSVRKYLVKDKGRPKIVRFLSVHTYFVSFLAIKKPPFSEITDKSIKCSLGQRIVGCGTIIIHSKDIDTPVKEVQSIKNVRTVSDLIDKYMNQMRDRYGIRGHDMVGISNFDSNNME